MFVILQTIQGILIGAISAMLVVQLDIPVWGSILQEFGRWAAVASAGVWGSLGVILGEEILLFNGNIIRSLLRFALLIVPHTALGLLWQRYGLFGGILAIAEHLAWNRWLGSTWWPIPVAGMIAIYALLIFHEKETL